VDFKSVTPPQSLSSWVTTDHYRFRVLTQGDPYRPWLLFLHGFLGDRFEFAGVMDKLAGDFFCVAPDLPGHGETIVMADLSPDLVYGMESTAQGIIACLGRLRDQWGCSLGANSFEKIGLVGYSLGGRLGLYLLLNYPHLFGGGLLESASPGLETSLERSARLQQDFERAEQLEQLDRNGFQQFLQQWYGNPIFQGLPEHPHYPLLLQQRQKGNPQHLAQSLRYLGLGAQPSLWTDLAHNHLPISLAVGEWDPKFVNLNQAMADRCPRSQLTIIPNVSHNIHWIKTTEFAGLIYQLASTI
jgi:2-succinyl-6-hydroxy-2,4-cyclohexadiene-1-carboxylate synthase